jgi:hypothetical protein
MNKMMKAFMFSPGPLSKFLRDFMKQNGLDKPQEALRQILRERRQTEQQGKQQG